MGRTPALKAAQKKYRDSRKRVEILTETAEHSAIQKAADAVGMSITSYFLTAVREKMERDAQ